MSDSKEQSELGNQLRKMFVSVPGTETTMPLSQGKENKKTSDIESNLRNIFVSVPSGRKKASPSSSVKTSEKENTSPSYCMNKSEDTLPRYTVNLKETYTSCVACIYSISNTKHALVCKCGKHWYCSQQCKDHFRDGDGGECDEYANMVINSATDSLLSFYTQIKHVYNLETLDMVKEYISSQANVSRSEMKKMAEGGDWKAALIIGLTYELRFVCEWDICQLALRPPFEKSRPFSDRKAIKYYKIAAEKGSVEASVGIGRALFENLNHKRKAKDNFMLGIDRFKRSIPPMKTLCFLELLQIEIIKNPHYFQGISGLILFKLKSLDSSKSIVAKEALEFPNLAMPLLQLKFCSNEIRLGVLTPEELQGNQCRIDNSIFKQELGKPGINLGSKMDAFSTSDDGYFDRLSMNLPKYLCEHKKLSQGNACPECKHLAKQRILSVYRNDYMMSRDETLVSELYGVIYSVESGLKRQDNFMNYSKHEVIFIIRVLALEPMDLHPLQLAKDPNIYWPIVHYYGSVYSALLEILEKKTVDLIYKDVGESTPLPKKLTGVSEEKYVLKCGNFPCLQLDWDFTFKRCVGCKLRRYCSPSCYKLDRKFHKRMCFLRPGQDTEEG